MLRTMDFSPRRAKLAVCLLLLSASRMSPAQSPLSLAGALAIAREHNPDLASAREAVEAALAQRAIAAQLTNPVLTATTNKIPTDGASAATNVGNGLFERSYDSTVALAQVVEIGGKRRKRTASAEEALAQARAQAANAERMVVSSVVHSYVNGLAAREAAQILALSGEAFSKSARLAADREQAGEISQSERIQVEIAAGRARADVTSADASFRNAIRSLEALLNLSATSGGRKLGERLDVLAETALEDETVRDDEVEIRRPDILALEAAVRRGSVDLDLQRVNRLPDPTLVAQYERQPPDQRNTVGFGISIAIPLLNQNSGAIAAAEVALSTARRELEVGRLKVRAELDATRDVLRAARDRLREYTGELLPKAEQVRSSVEYAYSQGAASLLELLEAERSANDVRLAAATARADLINARVDFAAARMAEFPERARP